MKGKNRLDFGFRPRENVILPRFLLTKGKNRAILGFQQAFLSWLYFRQYSREHSIQVMEIQRGQSAGSVFGRVAWGNARRGFTNTVASVRSCVQLYCDSHSQASRRGQGRMLLTPAAWGLALAAWGLALEAWGLALEAGEPT